MRDIFESYSGKELRKFIITHNKIIKSKVKDELKEIKLKILQKRLIDIRGLKKDAIIEKMLENKRFFKDIKMRPIKSEESVQESTEKLQVVLTDLVQDYIKTQDENKLQLDLRNLKKQASQEDLDTSTINIPKFKKEIISKYDKDLNKSKPQPPPRTKKGIKKNDPLFDLRNAITGTELVPVKKKVPKTLKIVEKPKPVPNITVSDFDVDKQKEKLIKYIDNKKVKEENRRDIALKNIKIDKNDAEKNPKGLDSMYRWVMNVIKNASTEAQLKNIKKFVNKKTRQFLVGTIKPKLKLLDFSGILPV